MTLTPKQRNERFSQITESASERAYADFKRRHLEIFKKSDRYQEFLKRRQAERDAEKDAEQNKGTEPEGEQPN